MKPVFSNWINLVRLSGTMLLAPSILAIAIFAFSFFSWNRMVLVEFPLLDIVMEIKVELERSHMALHELERNQINIQEFGQDPKVLAISLENLELNGDMVISSIAQAQALAILGLDGSYTLGEIELSHMPTKKTKDEDLILRLKEMQALLTALADNILPRIKEGKFKSFIYDADNDMLFEDAMDQAQLCDDRVHEIVMEQLAVQRRIFLAFVILFGGLSAYIFWKWKGISQAHTNRLAGLYMTSQAVEQSTDLIMIAERNGKIEYVNPMFSKVSGYSSEESLENSLPFLNHQDDPALFSEALLKISDRKKWQGEMQCAHKDGSRFSTLTTVSPLYNEANQLTHCVVSQKVI
ncbi:MAG: PAS domain S-box protein [Mariprofundaceae bacterium]